MSVTVVPLIVRTYGLHAECGGLIAGTHAHGEIAVQCYRCKSSGFAALNGKVVNVGTGALVDLITAATDHWMSFHGECSGEIFMHETGQARNGVEIRRVLRCRTHGVGFRIEVPA